MTLPSAEAQAYAARLVKALGRTPSVVDLTRLTALAYEAGRERSSIEFYEEGYRDGMRGSQIENPPRNIENAPACLTPFCACEYECLGG